RDHAARPLAHEVWPFPLPPLVFGEELVSRLGLLAGHVNEGAGEHAAPLGFAPRRASSIRRIVEFAVAAETEIELPHPGLFPRPRKPGLSPEPLSRLTGSRDSGRGGVGPFRLWPSSYEPSTLARRRLSLVYRARTRPASPLCTASADSVNDSVTTAGP